MKNAAQLRRLIEATLADRVPAALSPRLKTEQEAFPCGIEALDALLEGGLPIGAMTELVGPECSGRTSVALSAVAEMTLAGRVCAWIDVADTLDPEAAAATGVDLERLLWVRCGRQNTQCAGRETSAAGGMQLATASAAADAMVPVHGGGGSHPRAEAQGMPQAVAKLLETRPYYGAVPLKRRDKSIGTPGAANRPLTFRAEDRVEQVATDRQPARRGEQVVTARCAEGTTSARPPLLAAVSRPMEVPGARVGGGSTFGMSRSHDQTRLEQALKTADLLLQAGGFSVIVFDLGSTPPEIAWKIPLATWFRFRAACERTRVSLLLLTQHACARSSAGLVVRLSGARMECDGAVMTGVVYGGERERQRFEAVPAAKVVSIRKPPGSERNTAARWATRAAWAEARG